MQDEPSEPFHLISKGYFLRISLLRFNSSFFATFRDNGLLQTYAKILTVKKVDK